MLGKGLVGIERERIYVASKCGRYESGHDFSRETVIQSVKDSLKRLQLEYLDIVHCHDIEFVDLDIVSFSSNVSLHTVEISRCFFIFTIDTQNFQQILWVT